MWGAIAGAALGALAGGQADETSVTRNVAAASPLEREATRISQAQLQGLEGLVNVGPGTSAVADATTSSTKLADMLKQYAAGGFLPGEQDFATANKFAQSAFNPQAVALQQQFGQQQQRAAQLASQLGRPVNDPIIQAKLSQEYMQGQERLQAQQGAYASQFALGLPQQRLGYTAQAADVQSALASQAMANRQALLSLGSQVRGQEQQFRAATAGTTQSSGGGLKGAITGALGGAAGFMGLSNMFSQGMSATPEDTGPSPMGEPNVGPQLPMRQRIASQQPFSSPMGMPNVGPQLPMPGPWAPNTSSIPYNLQPPTNPAPASGSMGSIMQGVNNSQFTPYNAPMYNQYGFYTP